jgi:hypothetical protein
MHCCLFTHKTVIEALNRHLRQTRVIASGYCPPFLQTIVNIEFLYHCRVGCVLRFLFFFEALGIFLKQYFFWVGFTSSIKNFGRVTDCAGFNCACKLRWVYSFEFIFL